jgi:hypothetical protein
MYETLVLCFSFLCTGIENIFLMPPDLPDFEGILGRDIIVVVLDIRERKITRNAKISGTEITIVIRISCRKIS